MHPISHPGRSEGTSEAVGTIMIDATHRNVGNVPVSTPTVAGYVTGTPDIQWTPPDWKRFPHSGKLRIGQSPELAAYGSNAASAADIEQGAGTVSAFIEASKARLRLGRSASLKANTGHGHQGIPNGQGCACCTGYGAGRVRWRSAPWPGW